MTPDGLTELTRRLPAHADFFRNPAAKAGMGDDMRAATDVIGWQLARRHLAAGELVGALPADEAMALAQLVKRLSYDDAVRLPSSHDGGAERDAMLGGIGKLQRALADAGFAPR
jgi:hypothetical protein